MQASYGRCPGADPSTKGYLFVRGDEVWIARCPWWFGLDAGWCHEWVSARLYPSFSADTVEVSKSEPPGFREKSPAIFTGAPPKDVKITVKDMGPEKPPEVVCERGKERATFVPEGDPLVRVTAEWTWIPESTSFYLANVTYDNGEGVGTRTFWMKACASEPVMELSQVVVGPLAYWMHGGSNGWTVRYGDREIGTFKGDEPQFSPP